MPKRKVIIEEVDTKEKAPRAGGKDDDVNQCIQDDIGDDAVISLIQSTFLLRCPRDLLAFFRFCKSLSPQSPLEALFPELKLRLVGPFELLANGKGIVSADDDLTCCYRYFHDPPEMVSVLVESCKTDSFHIGYFRDDWNDEPALLVSSDPNRDGKLEILGDNIFAAVLKRFRGKHKKSALLAELSCYAKTHAFNVDKPISRKSVVCPTLNGVGLCLEMKNGLGYRPVPRTHHELKTMLQRVTEAKDARSRLSHQAKLEELITFTQFANDEGDYGQGLELGLDLLAFHPTGLLLSSASCLDGMITALLSTGYFLAGRSKFASVVQKHMKNRPATHVLTIEDVTKNKD